LGNIPLGDIEDTLEAIEIRNEIVHEGLNPQGAEFKNILMGLFRTISSLLLVLNLDF
jgi:hypothetical protein